MDKCWCCKPALSCLVLRGVSSALPAAAASDAGGPDSEATRCLLPDSPSLPRDARHGRHNSGGDSVLVGLGSRPPSPGTADAAAPSTGREGALGAALPTPPEEGALDNLVSVCALSGCAPQRCRRISGPFTAYSRVIRRLCPAQTIQTSLASPPLALALASTPAPPPPLSSARHREPSTLATGAGATAPSFAAHAPRLRHQSSGKLQNDACTGEGTSNHHAAVHAGGGPQHPGKRASLAERSAPRVAEATSTARAGSTALIARLTRPPPPSLLPLVVFCAASCFQVW